MTPIVTIVSLLTDRREFLPLLKACINNQNYDKSLKKQSKHQEDP